MAQILPDLVEFGLDNPDSELYPGLEPLDMEEQINPELDEELVPFGFDLKFDFGQGDLDTTLSGDIKLASENTSLEQWIANSLLTKQGAEPLFSLSFGSELHTLIGEDTPEDIIIPEVQRMIEEAILRHDRLLEVVDYTIDFNHVLGLYTVGFTVLRDDSDALIYRGLQIG